MILTAVSLLHVDTVPIRHPLTAAFYFRYNRQIHNRYKEEL